MDEGGDVSDIQQAVVPIEIPATELEEALGKHYTYETGLLMRPGRHAVAVGVRDEMGATSSFVTGQVDVGANTQCTGGDRSRAQRSRRGALAAEGSTAKRQAGPESRRSARASR